MEKRIALILRNAFHAVPASMHVPERRSRIRCAVDIEEPLHHIFERYCFSNPKPGYSFDPSASNPFNVEYLEIVISGPSFFFHLLAESGKEVEKREHFKK